MCHEHYCTCMRPGRTHCMQVCNPHTAACLLLIHMHGRMMLLSLQEGAAWHTCAGWLPAGDCGISAGPTWQSSVPQTAAGCACQDDHIACAHCWHRGRAALGRQSHVGRNPKRARACTLESLVLECIPQLPCLPQACTSYTACSGSCCQRSCGSSGAWSERHTLLHAQKDEGCQAPRSLEAVCIHPVASIYPFAFTDG